MSLDLRDGLRERAEELALITPERSFTWIEAAREVDRISDELAADGVAPHPGAGRAAGAVPLDAALRPETIFRLYALIRRRACVVPVSPRLTVAEREAVLATVAGAALPADMLALMPTAGTTGVPHFAALGREAFRASAAASAANLGWQPEDRWLLCMPLHHVGGLSVVTRSLLARRPIVLLAGFDAGAVIAAVREHRVTLASFVPAMLDQVLAAAPRREDLASLRAVLVGGGHAAPDLLARGRECGIPALATYGLTETCSQVTAQSPRELRDGAGGHPAAAGHSGTPLPGIDLRVRDERIEVRGPVLFAGYAARGGFTPAPVDEDGWFATGDLGEIDERGRLRVFGRADDIIVTGGEKVHPLEVEDALLATGLVSGACVFAVPDPRWGAVVCAALVPRGPRPADQALARALQDRLAPWKRPRRIAWMDDLARTAAGKPDRAETSRRAGAALHEIPRESL